MVGGDEMQFEEEPPTGGGEGQDSMTGMFTSLNIVDISEVFSPPRVVMQGMKIGLRAGSSMDLLTGWNFELKVDRDRALRQIEEEERMLVIGSPPCTYFSELQELNKHNQRHNEDLRIKEIVFTRHFCPKGSIS